MNIEVGKKLFEFKSKQDWINRAQRIWKQHQVNAQNTVCIDQKGRICGWGLHFSIAEQDNAYPIEVFWMRDDLTPNVKWMAFSPSILGNCHPSWPALQVKMASLRGF